MSRAIEFGRLPNGEIVYEYEIRNDYATVHILSYGAIIKDFIVKPVNRNIVLGYDSLEAYLKGTAYLGATVGRVANRIGGARTVIGGKEYSWTPNNGPNLLHSGAVSLSFTNWQCKDDVAQFDDSLVLIAKLDDDGFPGVLTVQLHVALVGPQLQLTFEYSTSEDSVVNITGHSYFNLNGHGKYNDDVAGLSIANHEVHLAAKEVAVFGDHSIPTGELVGVMNTAYDFTEWRPIGEALLEQEGELAEWRGYDHYYVLNDQHGALKKQEGALDEQYDALNEQDDALSEQVGTLNNMAGNTSRHNQDKTKAVALCGEMKELTLGSEAKALVLCGEFRVPDLTLRVYSDAPGYQFYTGNWLQERGHENQVYGPHAGMCIEPQYIPNDCNLHGFGQSFTKSNVKYERHIVYEVVPNLTRSKKWAC